MVPPRPVRRRSARLILVATTVVSVLLGASGPVAARAAGAPAGPAAQPPNIPGLAQVARPTEARPAPLPRRTGSVKVVKPAQSAKAAAAAGLNDQVALRALVIGTDANDFGVATWKTTLDRVGAAYDVFYGASTPLTTSTLVRPDGVGRYNAILLTNSMQVYESNGSYLTALDSAEWNILWAYERNFGVRQAALYTSYGTWPENYCLTSTGEGGVGSTPINLSLTATGAGVFDYLKSSIQIPVTQSYVYRTAITSGCLSAEATITNGSDVLGVRTTSADGRERLALTFTSNQHLTHSDLLVYGMLRWASKGMFLGEQRHHLNVDIDDWFNRSDHYYPDGHVEYEPGYLVSAREAVNLDTQQTALRTAHPQAAGFKLNLAFNGAGIDPFAGSQCSPDGGTNELTATSKCLKANFRWINHTQNHPQMNDTSYATSYAEINDNRAVGNTIGLNAPDNVLKTPEYSGLGVYNDPNGGTGSPVDHGLAGSNPELLRAAKDLGVKYLHGNMSFASHVPANLNAAKVHPLEPSISVVPDWPTNIAYFVTTPQEAAAFYNSLYGPNGRFPYWPQDLTYAQLIEYEAGVALGHVSSGAIYAHTFHIGNVRDYGSGRTLLTDWTDAVMSKYESYYSVPLLNEEWPALAAYTTTRTAHFAQLGAGVDPVYDRSTGTITVTSPNAGTVQISGAQGAGSSTYGTDVTTPLALTANTAATVTAVPHV